MSQSNTPLEQNSEINMADKAAISESESDVPAKNPAPKDSRRRKDKHSSRPRRRRSSFDSRYSTESELSEYITDGSLPSIQNASLKERPLNSGVRYYDYEGFLNRTRTDEGDFAIEVFVAKPDWYDEVQVEEDKRDIPYPPPPPVQRRSGTHRRALPTATAYPPPPPPYVVPQPQPKPRATGPPPYVPPLPRRNGIPARLPDQRLDGHKYAHVSHLHLSPGKEIAPEGRMMRIRVRSKVVLDALGSFAGEGRIAGLAMQFNRPFRMLEESHTTMKAKLTEMEKAFDEFIPPEAVVSEEGVALEKKEAMNAHGSTPSDSNALNPNDTVRDSTEQSEQKLGQENKTPKDAAKQDLEHMRCFVNFLEHVVLPIRETFRNVQPKKHPRVCFEDIPYLFRPGSLAYLTHETGPKRPLHRSAVQKVWRMACCSPAAAPSVFRANIEHEASEFTTWSLYSLDYDGERLLPIWTVVRFRRFKGERDITSLPCYPLSFHDNMTKVIEDQKFCGELFKKCITSSMKHHYYSGWTFITGLYAETLQDHEGEPVQSPEHVESEIVIDFKETLQNYPRWESELTSYPNLFRLERLDAVPFTDFPLRVWEGGFKQFPLRRQWIDEEGRSLIEEPWLYKNEAEVWRGKDQFLSKKADWQDWTWSQEDLALLPRRVFAYVLRERRFTRLDVRSIEFNTGQTSISLNQIQMRPERRRMIRSAVAAHFRGKKGPSTSDLDPIRGKGKGLVILLHGAPGVGKTATAEAVAAETERPLFPITCGDLGFSPAEVEKTLRDIFRYAHLWNCILLFDEADVFLTQRERGGGNLERNALVGVFLRVLEYYSGILFLTTNRVGALDEGFRSRVHLSLCYPNLSLVDTIKILEANLKRLPRLEYAKDGVARDGFLDVKDKGIIKFVSAQYEEYSKATGRNRGPWNGRQIRNAVQIAAGLALYDKQIEIEEDGEDNRPAILKARHFQDVADTTAEFEEYLNIVKIGDEEEQAKRRQERADHWRAKERYDEDDSDREIRRRMQTARYRDSSVDPGFSSSRARQNSRSQRSDLFGRTQPANRRRQDDMGAGRGAGREQQRPRGSRMTRPAQDDYHEDDDVMEDDSLRDQYDEEEEQDEYTYERRSQGERTGPGRQRV